MRRAELCGLQVDDVDFTQDVAIVLGKGRTPRACPFVNKTAAALDGYLRARDEHQDAQLPWLWLGRRGRLSDSGLAEMLRRRGEQAGIGPYTRISFGIRSGTHGSQPAAQRATSCASPVGEADRYSNGTARLSPTSVHVLPTADCHRPTVCERTERRPDHNVLNSQSSGSRCAQAPVDGEERTPLSHSTSALVTHGCYAARAEHLATSSQPPTSAVPEVAFTHTDSVSGDVQRCWTRHRRQLHGGRCVVSNTR